MNKEKRIEENPIAKALKDPEFIKKVAEDTINDQRKLMGLKPLNVEKRIEEKKYCKNCKYDVPNLYSLLRYCSPEGKEVGNKFSGSFTKSEMRDKTELNKDGNCPYYKKKWWKLLTLQDKQ